MPVFQDTDLLDHLSRFPTLQRLARPVVVGQLRAHPYSQWGDKIENRACVSTGFMQILACSLNEYPRFQQVLALIERALALFVPNPSQPPRGLVSGLTALDANKVFDTVSELALALELHRLGFEVRLAVPFFCKTHGSVAIGNSAPCRCAKDVDIVASRNGHDLYVDVLTLHLPDGELTYSPESIFVASPVDTRLDYKATIAKPIDKYRDKFQVAVDAGWNTPVAVAINSALDDRFSLARFYKASVGESDNWRSTASQEFGEHCRNATLLFFDYHFSMETASLVRHELEFLAYQLSRI